MTCFERYKQKHGRDPDLDRMCPHLSGGIRIDEPDYCPVYNGSIECERCWNRQVPSTMPTNTETVNHPEHYNREGGMECIDEMVLVFGKEAAMNFCLLNVWKYRFRAADKNGEEDLEKSDWYMAKYAELKGGD